ncbi:hypothetical protein B1222_06935 [Paenibacillus larvae subsp. pulvifaciens]|uniref:hypothetical protein n=1 Tax=Paenibacillus larvae TaxID=1464 RepID=UPI00098EFA4A|nr:hypothetical protein [Paenibacillus larvae]AQT84185.1 hypothetical protein B1222_06935 [Paenibacillus larvae subsp. pulvifaciens]
MKPGAFTAEQLEDGCIRGEKLAPNSIRQEHLSEGIIHPSILENGPYKAFIWPRKRLRKSICAIRVSAGEK